MARDRDRKPVNPPRWSVWRDVVIAGLMIGVALAVLAACGAVAGAMFVSATEDWYSEGDCYLDK